MFLGQWWGYQAKNEKNTVGCLAMVYFCKLITYIEVN